MEKAVIPAPVAVEALNYLRPPTSTSTIPWLLPLLTHQLVLLIKPLQPQKSQMKCFVFASPTPVHTAQPNLPPPARPGPRLPPENPTPHRCTSNHPLLLLHRPFIFKSRYSCYSRNNWTAWRPDWKPALTAKLPSWANNANHHTFHQTVLPHPHPLNSRPLKCPI
jgi:hypothetical protein